MRGILEAVGVALALLLAVVCWIAGVQDHIVAAVVDGAPEFVSTRYSGPWIAAATACVIAAGLLALDAARLFPYRVGVCSDP